MDYEKAINQPFNDEPNIAVVAKVIDPYDLETTKAQFQKYEDQIEGWTGKAKDLEIKDDTTNETATEMLAQVAGIIKDLDKHRKAVIAEPDRYVRDVNAFVRRFKVKLDGIVKDLKGKVGTYAYNLELVRREEERLMQEAADKKQKELDAQAKKADVEPVEMPKMVAPVKQDPVRTDSGTASTRMEWTYEITDFDKIPRQYLIINPPSVKLAIKSGIREVPGLRIFERPVVTVRRN